MASLGDPHSPYRYGTVTGQFRGLAHAHMGWLFRNDPTPATPTPPTCSPTLP
jgi:stearoyl-CoA desaturase (delta-9 desaturase)